jgi:transcriptional regulator with XRE-family HTH domain
MDMKAILDRISARAAEVNLTDRAISLRSGNSDSLINNWRKAVRAGRKADAQHSKLAAVASVLDVDVSWLISGEGEATAPPAAASPGMAESATPYTVKPHPTDSADPQAHLRALWGTSCTTPASYRIAGDIPAFGLARGDVLIADLARLPAPGELAIVTVADDDHATALTMICRYLPPFLTDGTLRERASPLRVDSAGVTVRYPVIGSIRGLPDSSG